MLRLILAILMLLIAHSASAFASAPSYSVYEVSTEYKAYISPEEISLTSDGSALLWTRKVLTDIGHLRIKFPISYDVISTQWSIDCRKGRVVELETYYHLESGMTVRQVTHNPPRNYKPSDPAVLKLYTGACAMITDLASIRIREGR